MLARPAVSEIILKVQNFLNQYNVGGNVLCALSGGCDSVVMTHILAKLLPQKPVVIHLNHNWRGEESLRDENFSKEFAKKSGLEFYSEKLSSDVKKTEDSARIARYDFFEKCAKKFNSNFIMLAHNKNDNAETVLYRIIKGTGIKGLCAISERRDIFYRPLLDVTRQEIELYAIENNLQYVNDSSNDDIKYSRNLIRKELLPLAQKINPDVINSLCNLSNLSKLQSEIISDALNKTKSDICKNNKINLEKFLLLSEALKLEVMNDFLADELKYRDFKRVKSYVDFVMSKKGKKSVNSELFLEVSEGWIYKSKKEKKCTDEILIKKEGVYNIANKTVVIEKTDLPDDFKNSQGYKYLSLDFSKDIILRTRREGDIFCPYGMQKGKMKLKEYLINEKIPRQKRDNLLLLTCGNEVLCIVGLQISNKVKADKDKECYRVKVAE